MCWTVANITVLVPTCQTAGLEGEPLRVGEGGHGAVLLVVQRARGRLQRGDLGRGQGVGSDPLQRHRARLLERRVEHVARAGRGGRGLRGGDSETPTNLKRIGLSGKYKVKVSLPLSAVPGRREAELRWSSGVRPPTRPPPSPRT